MAKVMLIMDMPESCEKCKLSSCLVPIGVGICFVGRENFDDMTKVQDWCPLRELPQTKDENAEYYKIERYRARGWNDCIEAILDGEG